MKDNDKNFAIFTACMIVLLFILMFMYYKQQQCNKNFEDNITTRVENHSKTMWVMGYQRGYAQALMEVDTYSDCFDWTFEEIKERAFNDRNKKEAKNIYDIIMEKE